MKPRILVLAVLFAVSCAFWQYALLLAARNQFPTKLLISSTCSGPEHAADREYLRLEDTNSVDVLVVGTADFVESIQAIFPRDSTAVVAGVVLEAPGPNQFATATKVFASKRPKVRVFQNAPHIWTDFSKDYTTAKQSTEMTKLASRARRNIKNFKTALAHLELSASLMHVLFANCDAPVTKLPETLLWSSMVPEDMLRERVDTFIEEDKAGKTLFESTYWVYDLDWIPRTIRPEVKLELIEFFSNPNLSKEFGKFVDIAGMKRALEAID